MKKKLLLIFIICLVLVGCSLKEDNEQIKFDKYDYFTVNSDMDDETLNLCLDYFKYLNATEGFCKNNEQIKIEEYKYYSLEQLIKYEMISKDDIEYLVNNNIVIHGRHIPVLYEIGEIFWPILRVFFSLL